MQKNEVYSKKYLLVVFICCWLGGIFDGMDSSLMAIALPSAIKDLIETSDKLQISQIGSYVTALFLIGWMLGGIFFGFIGDKFGRVKSMVFSILLYASFTGLAGFAQNWWQLGLCRFLTGLGIGGELVSIATFLTEVWPQKSRAIAVGILITSYQAGVFLAGSINYLFANWRHVFFIGALPALLVICLRLTLKESDRWENHEKENMPIKKIFQAKYQHNLLTGSLAFTGLLIGYWASLSWIPAWIDSLLNLSNTSSQRGIITMFQGSAAILGCTLAGFACDKIGRRKTLIISFAGCFLASLLLFGSNSVFSLIIYWETSLLGFFIGLAQASMYIYLPELFPTQIRATATGFCLNIGRLCTVFAVLAIGPVVKVLGGYGWAALVFAFAYLISMITSFWSYETQGQNLPE